MDIHNSSSDNSWSRAVMATAGAGRGKESSVGGKAAEWYEVQSDSLTPERMRHLALHKSAEVRTRLAARPDCPLGILIALAHDKDTEVRLAAASNEKSSRAVLEHLATDKNATVAIAVARNNATPVDILEKLAFHKKDEVKRAAAKCLDVALARKRAQPDSPRLMIAPPELQDRFLA